MAGLLAVGGGAAGGRAFGATPARPSTLIEAPRFAAYPFTLGVASGDPAADGFVIWTRLAPDPLVPGGGMPMSPVQVDWDVAADAAFDRIVCSGEAYARPELAHSVHVELSGLAPDRRYWYRFRAGPERSIIGSARTFPLPGSPTQRVRFAVAGCQHLSGGFYSAWRAIAAEEPDFVFHYGDYIYEGDHRTVGGRPIEVDPLLLREVYSLDDYRRRYALYKGDADLQAAHAAAPFFVTFDDHEIDNDWAGDVDQDGTPAEFFRLRRAAAFQAYYEHMPLRRASFPQTDHMQIFRRARYGDLLDAHFLDTRQYRTNQAGDGRHAAPTPEVSSTNRTMLGDAQERWLFDGLARSTARWNMIAQQVMMMAPGWRRDAHPDADIIFSVDQWSGYRHARQRLLDHIADHRPGNVLFVSGDAHRHYAGDVVPDNGTRAVASEYHATSISSGGDGSPVPDAFALQVAAAGNEGLKALINQRGYVNCEVSRYTWVGRLNTVDTIASRDGRLSVARTFTSEYGRADLL